MKEQRITIEIGRDGGLTADADGFEGDTCLTELDRLLSGLAAVKDEVERKPDQNPQVSSRRTQRTKRS